MRERTVLEVVESLNLENMEKSYKMRNGETRNIGIPLPRLAKMKVLNIEFDYRNNKASFVIDY